MKKCVFKFEQHEGNAPLVSLQVAGFVYLQATHPLSRVLTDTTGEGGSGIFGHGGYFSRGLATVEVNFSKELPFPSNSEQCDTFVKEVKERVNRVNNAFKQAYPSISIKLDFFLESSKPDYNEEEA